MNKVILCGRLTADPELRQTQSGVATCRFTIAVDRRFADKETGERQADFIPCIAWRQTAEFISKYFSKGKMICVEGSLKSGSYQDRNHPDVTHYTLDLNVDNVEFCGDRSSGGGQPANNQQAPANPAPAPQPAQQPETMSYGNLSDFEEILGDGSDLPF